MVFQQLPHLENKNEKDALSNVIVNVELIIHRARSARWHINLCELEHNHTLTSGSLENIECLRDIPPSIMDLIQIMTVSHATTTAIREAIRVVHHDHSDMILTSHNHAPKHIPLHFILPPYQRHACAL
jgi:hypothetical protein